MIIIGRECFIIALNDFNSWLNSGKKWTTVHDAKILPLSTYSQRNANLLQWSLLNALSFPSCHCPWFQQRDLLMDPVHLWYATRFDF